MKVDASVIKHLNKLLKNELTAINQYFLHYASAALGLRASRQEDLRRIDRRDEACRSPHQAHPLLEGLPNLQDLGKLLIGETVPECLRAI